LPASYRGPGSEQAAKHRETAPAWGKVAVVISDQDDRLLEGSAIGPTERHSRADYAESGKEGGHKVFHRTMP
jgi:hypothetical protein